MYGPLAVHIPSCGLVTRNTVRLGLGNEDFLLPRLDRNRAFDHRDRVIKDLGRAVADRHLVERGRCDRRYSEPAGFCPWEFLVTGKDGDQFAAESGLDLERSFFWEAEFSCPVQPCCQRGRE